MTPRRPPFHALALLLAAATGSILSGQEPERRPPAPGAGPEEAPAPEMSVRKVGEHRFRLGEIEFDAKTREIRFPAVVNLREGGPVEYLLVHETGKVHESILTTTVPPLHLQVVLKLLRYRAGRGDVFNRLLPEDLIEREGGKASDRGETASFTFTSGTGKPVPLHELVIDAERAGPMVPGGWVYTGSSVEEGKFMAEVEGSIIAVYLDPLAMFNTTREGADLDERWGARDSAIPAMGTRGTLTIAPGETPVTKTE